MRLKISTEFSKFPGPRYPREGEHSGEEFRKTVLFPAFEKAAAAKEPLVVDLDGTCGFGTSFLEEAFGGLIRENQIPLSEFRNTIRLISLDEPSLLDEIEQDILEAEEERCKNV